jgi:uncharacterized membrane protein YcjF (UPF0283 family)
MSKVIQRFLELLTDRLLAMVGSVVGTRVATFRVAQHADQQSQLEDLAREYEEQGKAAIAQQLRAQAARLTMDDPGLVARVIIDNVLADAQDKLRLLSSTPVAPAEPPSPRARRRRRRRRGTNDKSGNDES